jgi:hypothetical protein
MTVHEEIPMKFRDEEAFQELVESVYPAIKIIIKYFSLQVQLDFSFKRIMAGKISQALFRMSQQMNDQHQFSTLDPFSCTQTPNTPSTLPTQLT